MIIKIINLLIIIKMLNDKGIKKLDLHSLSKKEDNEVFGKSKSILEKNNSNNNEMNDKDV